MAEDERKLSRSRAQSGIFQHSVTWINADRRWTDGRMDGHRISGTHDVGWRGINFSLNLQRPERVKKKDLLFFFKITDD